MPQFRQDFVSKEWVIIAPERAKRPDDFHKEKKTAELPDFDQKCPFCPGNENQAPPSVLTMGEKDQWKIRVVPNKFAAVNPNLLPTRKNEGGFLCADGFGVAEVVIESRLHNDDITKMSKNSIKELITTYKTRYTELSKNKFVDLITIFRNHGLSAGTSLAHPHSQIIATPIVTSRIRGRLEKALIYHDTYGDCPYCALLNEELAQEKRIVADWKLFTAYCPYASMSPFEIRILPKRHSSQFSSITDDEIDELSGALSIILNKLKTGLNDPDYNMIMHSAPLSDGEAHYDHWRIIILPRLTTPAGFELGSGIFINIMPPEDCAKFLREIKIN